ncbi:nectin-3-like protein [Acanthopagrus latus]|uniref:nectin-3-like protein n=1 Tax=Acanthopagrus latus TaxID=8177 RepID=UPI00187C0796|nr:nectin-3-like protein [Acanthopagrus latus]
MAKSAPGTASYLLLLTSIIQGSQDVEVFHYKKMEAVVGQDVVLPCTVNGRSDLKLVSIEWSKNINEFTKLAVYSLSFGVYLFWPNISMQIEDKTLGSNLHLPEVSKWDSGVYICDIITFPLGTIRRETQLEIQDVDVGLIICDANSTLEVHAGENVTIHCTALPNVQYRWTKNKKLLSENASLDLSWVTDAHGGAYTLTVNAGNKSLHKTFSISVLPTTTSLHTVTTRSTWAMTTQHTVDPEVTSSIFPENSSTLGSIMENSNKPGATPTLITRNIPDIEDADGAWTHLLLRSIIVAVLILIIVAAFLYTKQRIKRREKLVRENTSNHLMASNQNNHDHVRFNPCSSDIAGESSSDV